MANYENALQAARSLWIASDSVSRQEFNAFARSLNLGQRYPGLQGIGWRSVSDGARAAFVARARADGEPGFTIRPPGRRPVYYVTLYSYPRIPSSSVLGADARAVPSVLAALEQARDGDRTTLSNQTTLPGDRDLAGWASGQFRAQDFLDAAMDPWEEQPFMGVELYDGAVSGGPLAAWPAGFRARGPGVQRQQFAFGGRGFLLRFAPLPGSPVLTDRTIPPAVVRAVGPP